jgi:hypothetical protein
MATNLTVQMEDRPGQLAGMAEALGGAGVNIDGLAADSRGLIHILVEDVGAARQAVEGAGYSVADEKEVLVLDVLDRPGELGSISRRFAEAGINIEVVYPTTTGRLVFGVDDLDKARTLL